MKCAMQVPRFSSMLWMERMGQSDKRITGCAGNIMAFELRLKQQVIISPLFLIRKPHMEWALSFVQIYCQEEED